MLLEVDNYSLAFRRYCGLLQQQLVPALHNLHFTIAQGEVLAMVGASGAGKSLLAHALFNILPPNAIASGQLRLKGAPLNWVKGPRQSVRQMGLVPQSISHLDPLVRCGKQLIWAARRSGLSIGTSEASAVLERFNLPAETARQFPHELSVGMARRLLLAMATIGNPALLVADEPTSGLDPANAQTVLDSLAALAKSGTGVLFITHDLTHAAALADRVVLLEAGQVRAIERAGAFTADGAGLTSPFARQLWLAMPQNAHYAKERPYARSA